MRLNRRRIVFLFGLVAVMAVGLVAIRVFAPFGQVAQKEKGTYYCPMHPTYTSDRPGDCPICNMRLVKRETRPLEETQKVVKSFEDICYMHNCPKIHEGRPCPMLVVAKAGEKVTCPVCGTHVTEGETPRERKILYWTDPMIPGYRSDKPGKSPMGMDLVPVYEEEAGLPMELKEGPPGYAPVLLTPKKQQLIGVKTAPVTRKDLKKTIRTVGRIAYDPELYQAQEEYLQALRALERAQGGEIPLAREQAKGLVDSARMRLRLLGLSELFIKQMDGWDGPDRRLLLSDKQGQVWLYASIYEFELPLVKVGQSVRAEAPSIPGKILEGTVESIDPVLDAATRSARVRAVLTDSEGDLRPEMYVNASIVVKLGEVLSVPEEAVFDTGLRKIVFVEKGQGLFEPRDVIVGVKADEVIEIKGGISLGERVVTSGNFLIDSESRLKAALQGMSTPPEGGGVLSSEETGTHPEPTHEEHRHAP